jgi:hypothetical protein
MSANNILDTTTQLNITIKPSDKIFKNIIIKSLGDDNMILLQKISADNASIG